MTSRIYLFIFNKFIYLLYFWLCWVFIAADRPPPAAESRGHSSLWCADLPPLWPLLLRSTGSRCAGFSCCSMWAQQLWLTGSRAQAQQLWRTGLAAHSMWDFPEPGLEPVSPALVDGLSTTAPPGKPKMIFLKNQYFCEKAKVYNDSQKEQIKWGRLREISLEFQ